MQFNPKDMSPSAMYHLMVGAIMPRPIAWVSTINNAGATNLAPFSFFNGVTASPPTLMFCPVNNRDGRKKDTVINIEETKEFAVNVVNNAVAQAMGATAASFPAGESEFELCNVDHLPCERIKAPRVKDVPVTFECTLNQIVCIGEGPLAAHIVIGNIELVHVQDDCLDADGHLLHERLDLIGRMGGNDYVATREVFEIGRPK